MSSALAINYSSISDAASEANSAAKKLTTYANNLSSQVYKKLNSYSGDHTSNISSAMSRVNTKISNLEAKATAYKNYANDLKDLKTQCQDTDKAVKSNISSLTSQFKKNNGISNNVVINTINYYVTALDNSTVVGRWLGNAEDYVISGMDYLKQSIEDWWDYEGGKQVVEGIVTATLDIAINVIDIVVAVGAIAAAIATGTIGFALVAAVCSFVVSCIAAVNDLANIANEISAYNTTQNGDPATGRRRSDIDSVQDYWRSSFVYGADGENYEYNSTLYAIATGIDVVDFVCNTISIVYNIGTGISDLIKKGYKWTTGIVTDIKELKLKDICSKDNLTQFLSKVKSGAVSGFTDIKSAIATRNLEFFKLEIKSFGTDFLVNLKESFNLKKKYFSFDTEKNSLKSLKAIFGTTKNLISDDFDIGKMMSRFKSYVWKNFSTSFLKSADILSFASTNTSSETTDAGKSKITLKDLTDIKDNIKKLFSSTNPFSSKSLLGNDLLEKLSTSCSVDISIPDIYVPEIEIPEININKVSFA